MGKNNKIINKYFKDIDLFEKYMKDLDNITSKDLNNSYSEEEFWHLLLLLCRTYINDNFHRMLEIADEELLKIIANENAKGYFFDNTFIDRNGEILNLLFDNQYFRCNKKKNDYKHLFIIIRNHLAHYNYTYDLKNHYIIIDDKYNKITISVASLTLFLLAGLSCVGQSRKKGAFDTQIVLSENNLFNYEITITNINDNNENSPLVLFRTPEFKEILLEWIIRKHNKPDNLSDVEFENVFKNLGIEVTLKPLKQNILDMMKKYSCSKMEFPNLYNMIDDDIKRATIMFKLQVTILYQLLNKSINTNNYNNYLDILNNSTIINYLDIVFCDYVIRNNVDIIKDAFLKVLPENCRDIPRKIRNSIAHCHYRISDIVNNNSDIVFELWDEYNNIINFECTMTKENAIRLIKEYMVALKKLYGIN